MTRPSMKKDLSLKWLELFQICAQKGSLQAAAKETGLTISTVSHHLRSLEDHLGVELFDHSRRPMILTPKGTVFLRKIEDALLMIREAKAEASAGGLAEASLLRIGTIEDFDSDIMPEIAVYLSQRMAACDFIHHTDSSHAILERLRNRHLDLGITSTPPDDIPGLRDLPLLRDPFVVVLPKDFDQPASEVVKGQSALPFLRFSGDLLIARQIGTHLRRLGLTPPSSFESSNNQTLMAMVASSAGWTITTPLLFARAKRFQSKLAMHKFPGKNFARTLSIMATPDCSKSVLDLIDGKMRALLMSYAISNQISENPWLEDRFTLIE